MLKTASLRDFLTQHVPYLAQAPGELHVFVDRGKIAARASAGHSLSFRYSYTALLIMTGFTGEADEIFVPLIAWISKYQPDLLIQNKTGQMEKSVRFEVEVLDKRHSDVQIELDLTERVWVTIDDNGQWTSEHLPEPELDDGASVFPWQLFVKGVRVA